MTKAEKMSKIAKLRWEKGSLIPHSNPMKGKSYSDEVRKKMSLGKIKLYKDKTKHPRWNGGISKDNHGSKENQVWRSKVFERDNWTCQTCQLRGVYLEAHHIKSWARFPEFRFILDNGVTLCRECHKLTDNYRGKGHLK